MALRFAAEMGLEEAGEFVGKHWVVCVRSGAKPSLAALRFALRRYFRRVTRRIVPFV